MTKPSRVMVIDNNAEHRETLCLLLSHAGVSADAFERATDALAVLERDQEFDLIMSDVAMPEMDGIEFSRQCRRLCPDIPIVLMTGRDSRMDAALEEGTVPLIKPYTVEALNAVLAEYLDVRLKD
ncbi:MAG: response regulator [Casimicrobiaceae bacterium]